MNYGKPNYDKKTSAFPTLTFYQLKSKSKSTPTPILNLIMRLAPPIKSNAERGVWCAYLKTHFGYTLNITKKDGTTANIPQPFICLEKTDRNKNITQHCDECDEVTLQKEKLDSLVKRLEGEKKTEEEIAVATKYQKQWVRDHNIDGRWHIFAKDTSGKWGILKISNRCKKLLDEKIKELVAKGIDPLSPQRGVWFKFVRNNPDSFNQLADVPEVLMEEGADGAYRMKFDTFTASDDAQLEEMPDLFEIGRRLTSDQVKSLVASGGNQDVVKAVFQSGQKKEETSYTNSGPADFLASLPPEEELVAIASALPPTPVPQTIMVGGLKTDINDFSMPRAVELPLPVTVTPKVEVVEELDEEAVLMQQLAAAKARKAQKALSVSKPQMPENVDDFLKMIEST
jgi:hypothetical protein